jgi:hypothetical protein
MKHGFFPRLSPGPLLLISLLVILFALYRPAPRPRIAPPWAINNPFGSSQVQDIPLPALEQSLDQFMQRTDLRLASAEGLYSAEEQQQLATELEWALAYVANRFGSGPAQHISTEVQHSAGCELGGVAYTSERRIQVTTCASMPRARVVNILAHEFVHQLAHDYYGPRHLQADMLLLEGLATWGAGDYWLSGQPSFRAFVRQHIPPEQRLPLATSYVGRPIADMNTLYYQWASFVEYLLHAYGRERFDALYITGQQQAPGSADYAGVYGKDLPTLEQEWLAWLAHG